MFSPPRRQPAASSIAPVMLAPLASEASTLHSSIFCRVERLLAQSAEDRQRDGGGGRQRRS